MTEYIDFERKYKALDGEVKSVLLFLWYLVLSTSEGGKNQSLAQQYVNLEY